MYLRVMGMYLENGLVLVNFDDVDMEKDRVRQNFLMGRSRV